MEFKLDMSMMFAMHDALRRELVQVARIGRRTGDNPGQLLRAALGWELFKKFLLVYHQSEDDTLWPTLRTNVAGQPDRVALADALEAEHAVIEPLLTAIDAAAADPGPAWLYWFDDAELAAQSGQSLLDLGVPHEAGPLLEQALAMQDPAYRRDRALYSARAAEARALTGDAEGARLLSREAAVLSRQCGSPRLTAALAALGSRLDAQR